ADPRAQPPARGRPHPRHHRAPAVGRRARPDPRPGRSDGGDRVSTSTLVFRLPDLGEGLTEAEIVAWHVSVGDTVGVDQEVVTVETAKAAVDVPCPYAG